MEFNIRIVTNAVKFWIVDARTFVRNQGFDFVADEAPTVSLYHHVYKMPYTKSSKCNHSAFLWEVDERSVRNPNDCVYYGDSESTEIVDLTQKKPAKKRKVYGDSESKEIVDLTQKQPAKKRKGYGDYDCKKVVVETKKKPSKKRNVLANWLDKVVINHDAVKVIEEKSVERENMERLIICMDVFDEMIRKISSTHTESSSSWSPLVKGRVELPWTSKAYILYILFYIPAWETKMWLCQAVFLVLIMLL